VDASVSAIEPQTLAWDEGQQSATLDLGLPRLPLPLCVEAVV
jgi:hypothetical protein